MKLPLFLAIPLCVLFTACGDDDDAPATKVAPAANTVQSGATAATSGSPISVDVADNSFSPANLTVPKGTKVTWSWSGRNQHSVVGSFDSKPVESNKQATGTFAFTFDKAGTFDYQCGVHGASMPGKVTVKE